MHYIGIDENGLGPILGPMIVTGVSIPLSDESLSCFKKPSKNFSGFLDSKRIFRGSNRKKAEALALSIINVLTGHIPLTMGEMLDAFMLKMFRPSSCKKNGIFEMCVHNDLQLPLWSSSQDIEETSRYILEQNTDLCRSGLIRFVVYCPYFLNNSSRAGRNKFDLDCDGMLSLVEFFRINLKGFLNIIAGKVGSRVHYENKLNSTNFALSDKNCSSEESRYYFYKDEISLNFIENADDKFTCVSIASIVGKYVREIFMEVLWKYALKKGVIFHRRPSGYRDRVSKEFINSFLPILKKEKIDTVCFLRER